MRIFARFVSVILLISGLLHAFFRFGVRVALLLIRVTWRTVMPLITITGTQAKTQDEDCYDFRTHASLIDRQNQQNSAVFYLAADFA